MPRLRHSAADWCFFNPQYDAAKYYRSLKDIGYHGVEMVEPERFDAARAAGLEIVNLSGPGKERGLNDPANHAELMPEIRRVMALAGANGIRQVIVFAGNRGTVDDATGLANVATALRTLAPEAQRLGVTLAFEMFNTFDHPGYMADNSAFGFELARQVGSPSVKVLFDIYHMFRMGEDVHAQLVENLHLVSHIHTAASPKRNRPGPTGAIPYQQIVRHVHAAGYRGYWGHEFLPAADSVKELQMVFDQFEEWAA
jgi:hydroxypyruvate isomerase